MTCKHSVLSGRMWKILAVCLALVALAVVLPTVVLAATNGDRPLPAGPQITPGGHRGVLHSGDWTETEPWASMYAQEASADSGLGLSIVNTPPQPFYDDMESGTGGWTTTGTWALTTEWFSSPTHSWTDSPAVNYTNFANASLTSPVIDMAMAPMGDLLFNFNCDLEEGYDYLYVEFSNNGGSTWSYYGDSLTGSWTNDFYYAYIPPEMCTSTFKFRFRLETDDINVADGVHIDDVVVSSVPTDYAEETDGRLTYLGNWGSAAWPSWAGGGTYKYSTSPGAAVVVDFTGAGVVLIGKTGPEYGIAKVSLDGGPAQEVDFYVPWWDSGRSYPMGLYESGNLTDGPHTLTMWASGTKNPASSGYGISADLFATWGGFTSAPAATRYQQDDTHLAHTGTWGTASTWSASGGSYTSVDAPGSAVNVTFDGTYLGWLAKTGPGYGKAQVSLDGGPPVTVDLYSSYDRYKRQVYGTGLLVDGSHTLSIYWTGQKNRYAWGTKIDVDAFDLLGAITYASAPEPIVWRYQQSDPRVTYLGSWLPTSTWSASGGSLISTSVTGAAALVKFIGPSVNLLAKTAPWYGKAEVSLDGGAPEYVDFYSATQLYKQAVYTKTGLSPVEHILTIKCAGDKNASSTGYSIGLDALDVGYLVQAPAVTRYQQDNVAFTYSGTWTTSATTWLASGGSYTSANVSGAKVVVSFTGPYLAWYAKTAPWYGKATLTIDGDTAHAVTVDLYSSSQLYKKQVYNTGLLANMSHMIIIEWAGAKRAASSGTTIDVDTFDIVGSLP
jgi:hypothetical protein